MNILDMSVTAYKQRKQKHINSDRTSLSRSRHENNITFPKNLHLNMFKMNNWLIGSEYRKATGDINQRYLSDVTEFKAYEQR